VIAIIPCGAKKRKDRSPAYAMYLGTYFKINLRYALSITNREYIFILSAKYGLLGLEDEIEPYNIKMGDPGCVSVDFVLAQARRRDLLGETAICLGGHLYTDVMRQIWCKHVVPLDCVGRMGYQMQWLKRHMGIVPGSHKANLP